MSEELLEFYDDSLERFQRITYEVMQSEEFSDFFFFNNKESQVMCCLEEEGFLNAYAEKDHDGRMIIGTSAYTLSVLDDYELMALVGHELGHHMRGDTVDGRRSFKGGRFLSALALILSFSLLAGGIFFVKNTFNHIPAWIYFILALFLGLIIYFIYNLLIYFTERRMELSCDKMGVKASSATAMISLLKKLHSPIINPTEYESSFYSGLFSTHPSQEKRIKNIS